jgi:hypothetical protein
MKRILTLSSVAIVILATGASQTLAKSAEKSAYSLKYIPVPVVNSTPIPASADSQQTQSSRYDFNRLNKSYLIACPRRKLGCTSPP